MVLTIGRSEVECESFRVRGAYSSTIARLFALPVAVASKEPLTLEVTIKGNKFKPYKASRRVYWNKKHVGFFVLSNVSQEWDGDKYRTRLELKQCERSDVPDEDIPAYKWRHDLRALADNLPQTDGAKIEAGRAINPFADSWKLGTNSVADVGNDVNVSPAVLPVSQGGTGASDPAIAIVNLGGISSASKGVAFGVAPLGADGKVSALYLPSGSGGGGGNVVFPITIAQGGTNALDAATARANLGAISLADLPPYPTLTSLGAVSNATFTNAINALIPISAIGAASGVTPLGSNSLVPSSFLPAYPTLASLGAVATSTYTAGLALKLDASARNTANGVAGIDINSLIATAQIPLSVQFQLLARTASIAVDFNTMNGNHGSVRFFDNNVVNPNAPAIGTNGTLLQFESLFGVASNLWKSQTFIGHNSRRADRSQNNGVWGIWNEVCYLNGVQPFTAIQDFNVGARFRAGGIPAVTTSMVQAGVDDIGQPRYWIVNASATAGNRLKSITIAANGNIQFRHHADNGADGNVLEHTASGNVLTNGTIRCGAGTAHFTGASFVPGALFFRSDLSMLLFSDGTNWRRMDTNAIVT